MRLRRNARRPGTLFVAPFASGVEMEEVSFEDRKGVLVGIRGREAVSLGGLA